MPNRTGSFNPLLSPAAAVGRNNSITDSLEPKSHSNTSILVNPDFPISKMKFNVEGDLIASVTSHDRLIRICTIPEGHKVATLQPYQSSNIESTIIDMNFCAQTNYFCCLI